MTGKELYLKQNAFMEPLVNQWYAWPYLIPAQTLAMMVANWHLKIMQSYIKSPALHANAVKNPKMLGGPFIDLPGNQTKEVQELLDRTVGEQGALLELAEAIKTLDDLLTNEARGFSLVSIYEKIPAPLRGFVELGYDLNNNPSFRFIERMLYRSPYYDTSRQSLALSLLERDDRAFALSTPRFPDAQHLHLRIPFDSDAIDRLFRMREAPSPLSAIEDLIPEDAAQRELFLSLFTETPPTLNGRDRETLEGVRIKYCGHAVLLFETKDVSIITDPLISYEIPDKSIPRYTFQDLPETIDYAVVTHGHQDHIMFETLLQLRHKIKTIVVPRCNSGPLQDPSLKLILENTGFKNVVELDEMERIEVPGGAITGLPFFGEHGDVHIRGKIAYHIDLKGKTAICAADSNNLVPEMYEKISDIVGPVDKIFLGMECQGAPMSWLYGPLLTKPLERRMDQSRRFDGSDCDKGMAMVDALKPKSVFVYAMGQEPWLTFISSIKYTETSKPIVESNNLLQECQSRGYEAERLFGRKDIYF